MLAVLLGISNLTQAKCSRLSCLPANDATTKKLTPPHEPKTDSFYVCYKDCAVKMSSKSFFLIYRKHKYLGCIISRAPCHKHCEKKAHCPMKRYKQFGWFNNYYDALNAFYRCAYS